MARSGRDKMYFFLSAVRLRRQLRRRHVLQRERQPTDQFGYVRSNRQAVSTGQTIF
jgi:hypothetical protein